VLEKLREELGELEAALASGDRDAAAAELGDLIYAATSLARHLGVVAEDALQRAADRFAARFRHMEAALAAEQRDVHGTAAAELEVLWQAAKRALAADASD